MAQSLDLASEEFAKLAREFDSPDHDLLLLDRDVTDGRPSLWSCLVERAASPGGAVGDYRKAPILRSPTEPGTRKVMSIAREAPFEETGGPVFATLPVKPEPGSTHYICYFVNSKRLGRRRWSFDSSAAQPPPSLLVAEGGATLRLYESVGRIDDGPSGPCRAVLESGFIVGTLPARAAYGKGSAGTAIVVNLTPLESADASCEALPGLAIITPHDNESQQAKVFWFKDVDRDTAPIELKPGDPAYARITSVSTQECSTPYDTGAALSLVLVGEGGEDRVDTVVICARRLLYNNEWTRADWAGPLRTKKLSLRTPERHSMVVATPDGGLHKYLRGEAPLPLALNTDAWNQLRNGCVLGALERRRVGGAPALAPLPGSERVPLVNLCSLDPDNALPG